jgi:hypothetical protein
MNRNLIRIFLQLFPLLIPLNFFIIGDWLGAGLQWAVVRVQQVMLNGDLVMVVFPITKEIGFVLSGTITGRSAGAILVWCAGAILLVAAFLLVLYRPSLAPAFRPRKYVPHATIAAGLLFIASCMLQHGYLLHGVAGASVPVGAIVVIALGYWGYRFDTAAPESAEQ